MGCPGQNRRVGTTQRRVLQRLQLAHYTSTVVVKIFILLLPPKSILLPHIRRSDGDARTSDIQHTRRRRRAAFSWLGSLSHHRHRAITLCRHNKHYSSTSFPPPDIYITPRGRRREWTAPHRLMDGSVGRSMDGCGSVSLSLSLSSGPTTHDVQE
jgi:hypothetical protein